MTRKIDPDVPFSFPVKVGHVAANPVEITLSADPEERKGLARLWNILSVERLDAVLHVNRWKKDGIRVRGTVEADVTQACVVTLEPVPGEIREEIDQVFLPEGSKLLRRPANDEGELFLDPDGPDLPDVFSGDTIDTGAIVAEFAALALDPYPRKQGVAFSGHIESKAEDDVRPSPFAVLKSLKKD